MAEIYISAAGPRGEKGEKGDQGTKWFDGRGEPLFVAGAIEGDYYIDTETGKVYKLMWVT